MVMISFKLNEIYLFWLKEVSVEFIISHELMKITSLENPKEKFNFSCTVYVLLVDGAPHLSQTSIEWEQNCKILKWKIFLRRIYGFDKFPPQKIMHKLKNVYPSFYSYWYNASNRSQGMWFQTYHLWFY